MFLWILKILPLLLFMVNLFIWVYIFAEKRKNRIDNAFLYYAGAMAVLTLMDFFMIAPPSRVSAQIIVRSFGLIDPLVNFLLLNIIFKLLNKKINAFFVLVLVISTSFGLITAFSELVFVEFDVDNEGVMIRVSETLPPLFGLGRMLPIFYSFFLLLKYYKRVTLKEQRKPIKILLLGLTVSFLAILIFNGIPNSIIRWHPKYHIEMYHLLIRSIVLTLELVLIFIVAKRYRFLSIGIKDISYEIFEGMRDALIVVNSDKTILHANKSASVIFKKALHQLIGIQLCELFNGIEIPVKTESTELITQVEGKEIILNLYSTPILYRSVELGVMMIFRDVTEERKIARELKESREDLNLKSLVFDNTSNALFVIDLDGKIVHWNKGSENTFGFTREEAIGNYPHELFEKMDSAQGVMSSVLKGEQLRREIITRTKDGNEIILDELVIPLYDTENALVGGLTIALDITARKKSEIEREKLIQKLAETNDELERSNEELEKTNTELLRLSKMKDDFLAIASHDLRAPFNGILGASELLSLDETLTERQKTFASIIHNSAKTQLQYVDDILEILRFESEGIKMNYESAELDKIIEDCVSIFQILAMNKNIEILVETDKEILIEVDVPKFSQVLNNLLSNAIKFTHNGGKIILRAFKNSQGYLEIHVIDSGIGIPPDKVENLFKSYQQVHQSGTAGEKGTGLGLTVCKKMIEAHGGNISVKSEINTGTDFTITLPLKKRDSD